MIDLEKFKQIVVENWQAVLMMLLGRDTQINLEKKDLRKAEELRELINTGQFFVQFEVSGKQKGVLICKNMLVSIISNLMMGIEAFKGEITPDDRDAFLEALNQMFAATIVPFREKIGADLKFSGFSMISFEEVNKILGEEDLLLLEIRFEVEKAGEEKMLIIVPANSLEVGSQKKAETSFQVNGEKKKEERAHSFSGSEAHKIDLLLDLELPVMVRIGSTELKIIDIMKLGIGSIIELEKHVDDAVDLLVNNRLVARGEVVIYENNFGIRIIEVVSKEERIKSLGG